LASNLDHEQRDLVVREAHTIKGSAAAVGGEALADGAAKLEQAGRSQDWQALRIRYNEIQQEFVELKQAMEKSTLLVS
jgi:HPt (histidine-containing phosphotransfer) domain-containing protein